jgi:hypothetical protein
VPLQSALVTPNPDGLHQTLMVLHAKVRRLTLKCQSEMVYINKSKINDIQVYFNSKIFSNSFMTEQYCSNLTVVRFRRPQRLKTFIEAN